MPTKKPNSSAGSSSSALDPSRGWSLDELEPHLPAVPPNAVERMHAAIRGTQGAAEFAALGARYRTEDILAAVPPFAVGVLLALGKLDAPPTGFAPALLPLLFRETRELARANTAYEEQTRTVASRIAGRREQLKVANSKGLQTRSALAKTLSRAVLPKDHPLRAELPRAIAVARTPASTAASMRRVADIAAEASEDPEVASLLRDFGYTSAFLTDLRKLADHIEQLANSGTTLSPPQAVDQAALDAQDGIVLTLLRTIYWPFRDAYDAGAPISLPPLGAVGRLVSSPSSAEDDEDPAEPPATDEPVRDEPVS